MDVICQENTRTHEVVKRLRIGEETATAHFMRPPRSNSDEDYLQIYYLGMHFNFLSIYLQAAEVAEYHASAYVPNRRLGQ
jgi:hypothetical protein